MPKPGARPRSYPFAQHKQVLIDGDFDAQENPISVICSNGPYEAEKFLPITNHSCDAMPLIIFANVYGEKLLDQIDDSGSEDGLKRLQFPH